MGRPKAREPRAWQLNLSLTSVELDKIQKRAAALGMRVSDFGRAALLNAGAEKTLQQTSNNIHRAVHQQLIRLGNNLNQMVRHLHLTGEPLPSDLEPLLTDIRGLIERLAP